MGRRCGQESVRKARQHVHESVMQMGRSRQKEEVTQTYVLTYETPDGMTFLSIIQLGGNVLYFNWMEGLQAKGMSMISLKQFNSAFEPHIMAAIFHLSIKQSRVGLKLVLNLPDVFLQSLIPDELRVDASKALASLKTICGLSPLPTAPTPKPLPRRPDETPAVRISDETYHEGDTLYIP